MLGRIWPKNDNTCKGPWVPTKFHQNPSSGSGKEVENVKSLRTVDGRTDDGRCAMTIAHSSLRLRWAKNKSRIQSLNNQIDKERTNRHTPDKVIPICSYALQATETLSFAVCFSSSSRREEWNTLNECQDSKYIFRLKEKGTQGKKCILSTSFK